MIAAATSTIIQREQWHMNSRLRENRGRHCPNGSNDSVNNCKDGCVFATAVYYCDRIVLYCPAPAACWTVGPVFVHARCCYNILPENEQRIFFGALLTCSNMHLRIQSHTRMLATFVFFTIRDACTCYCTILIVGYNKYNNNHNQRHTERQWQQRG